MAWCTQRKDGVSLSIKVKASAKRDNIVVVNDLLKIEVHAPALEGRANVAVIALLAERFNCARADIELLRGEHTASKIVLLRGMSLARVLERLPV